MRNVFVAGTRAVLSTLLLVVVWVGSVSAITISEQEAAPSLSPDVDFTDIVGRVINEEQPTRPVVGAMVSVVELGKGRLTDRSGRFVLDQLPPGTYTVRVRHVGFGTFERQVTVPEADEVVISLKPEAYVLDPVVATASAYGSPVVYQAVQAFTREDLQRRMATSLGDMLDGEPGIAMSSEGNVVGRPVIRGLGDSRVLILEDGARMGDLQETGVTHAVTTDPVQTDRIEVVRGPAGVLYGSQAMGGVINLERGEIPMTWPLGLSGGGALQGATMNNLGAGFGRAVYGGERWAGTARASYRESGEIRTPDGRLPYSQSRTFTGGAGAAYSSESFNGGLAFGLYDQVHGLPQEVDDIGDEAIKLVYERRTAQGRGHWQLDGFFHDLELRINANRHWQEEWEMEEVAPGVFEEDDLELGFKRLSIDTRATLRHSYFGPFDRGAVGAQVRHESVDAFGDDALTPDARRPQMGLFSFQDLPVTDRLRLQLGARIDLDMITTLPNDHFPDADDERFSATGSGSVSASYRPASNLELALQLSRAHRSPIIEELFTFGPHTCAGAFEIGDPGLKDEVGHGLDFTIRHETARTGVEVASYYNSIRDYVVFQPTGEMNEEYQLPIFVYEADDAVFRGMEVAFDAELLPSLHMRLTGDYVRADRADGTPLPFIPPLRASVHVTRDTDWGWLGARVRTVAAQERVAPEEDITEGYSLFGFEAGYRVADSGVFSLRVDNALDTAYRDHLSRIEDRDRPMPGRNINVTYRWAF